MSALPKQRTLSDAEKAAIDALHKQLQTVLAGSPSNIAFGAMEMSMAAVIGFCADDRAHAGRLVELVACDMHEQLDLNWDYLREVRAGATQPRRA